MAETYITNLDTDVHRMFLLCKQIAGTSACIVRYEAPGDTDHETGSGSPYRRVALD